MTINTIIYVRTSADCAVPAEEQVKVLRGVAVARGWTVSKVFHDRPMPPKRGREQRPGEVALLSAIRSGSPNRVLLWSLDRVGRSLVELVTLLETCRTAGAELYLHDHRIDTGTSNGLELFDISKMLANHLRQSRRGRILRGQAAARGANVKFGRPPIAMTKIEKVRRELPKTKPVRLEKADREDILRRQVGWLDDLLHRAVAELERAVAGGWRPNVLNAIKAEMSGTEISSPVDTRGVAKPERRAARAEHHIASGTRGRQPTTVRPHKQPTLRGRQHTKAAVSVIDAPAKAARR